MSFTATAYPKRSLPAPSDAVIIPNWFPERSKIYACPALLATLSPFGAPTTIMVPPIPTDCPK